MKSRFKVTVERSEQVALCEGMWPVARRRELLAVLMGEAVECSESELDEMLQMALQDQDPVECGAQMLEFVFGDVMTPGQRDEISRDMAEEKPWEHGSHIEWHRGIFEAAYMVRRAHGGKVQKPTAVRLTLSVTALDDDAREAAEAPLTPAFAARLVAPVRPSSILMRLFDEAIEGRAFPDAPHVVWHCAWASPDASRATVQGSEHWFSQFEEGDTAELAAWPDREPEGD
ncbi:MAG: hypothetical protein R3F39_07435 [Myxococcota bacterium]